MARAKRDEVLRYEEDSFIPKQSEIVTNEGSATETRHVIRRGGRGKRSLEEMMGAMAGVAQSAYALERIAAQEDVIVKILRLCDDESRAIVLRQRPSMKRYWQEED